MIQKIKPNLHQGSEDKANTLLYQPVFMACKNPQGVVGLYHFTVAVTPQQIAAGLHHRLAEDEAKTCGYCGPFTILDKEMIGKRKPSRWWMC